MWNDTDIPLAYLITFRCYGTWLHGDARGSIDRFRNQYQSPYIEANEKWHRHNLQNLKGESVNLNANQREIVEQSIRECCNLRDWFLRALNVRTNHVHVVVSIGSKKPELALNAFKANATRHLREHGCWHLEKSPWSDKGSKRRLWNDPSVERAIHYVINGQGDELPDFD
jgi:REP element-mobilizing transposase RayT